VIWGQLVSGNYFDVLRVKPILGRTFAPEEDKTPGAQAVVVLATVCGQRRFAADQNIVGKTVDLNGRAYNVIGIAPESFRAPSLASRSIFGPPMMMAKSWTVHPSY